MIRINRQVIRSIIFLFVCLVAHNGLSQVSNINSKISIVGGEAFYIHTVLKGQTIAQIAQAYFTDQSSIVKYNGSLSEPLAEETKLKIPYTDESLESMRNTTSDKTIIVSKPMAQTTKPDAKPLVEQTQQPQPTPMEEAVSLIPNEPEEASPKKPKGIKQSQAANQVTIDTEETAALENLDELSNTINKSLANLAKIKAALHSEKKTEEKQFELPEQVVPISSLLNEKMHSYFDTASINSYRLSEYFIVRLNADQRISGILDERTVTNNNTHFFELQELRGAKIDSLNNELGRKAIGFISEVNRHPYKVKVKRKKVRVYKTQGYVEHFSKDHAYTRLIIDAARKKGLRGKCEVVILDGYTEVATFKQFEYNPFGTKESQIMRQRILFVDEMKF